MPELPEVYTSAIDLSIFTGYLLLAINHHSGKCLKGEYHSFVSGVTVSHIGSRGKKLIFYLSNGHYLVFSYLMEGKLMFNPVNELSDHLHLTLVLRHPTVDYVHTLYYYESRPFGGLNYCNSQHSLAKALSKIGLDLVQDGVTVEKWLSVMRSIRSTKPIAEILLDQTKFAGIGNYLRADILYDARIHPMETLSTLTNEDLVNIYHSTMKIINYSISTGGASIMSYLKPDGNPGLYKPLVYSLKFDSYGNQVTTIKSGDRNIYYAPNVQILKSVQYYYQQLAYSQASQQSYPSNQYQPQQLAYSQAPPQPYNS